MKNKIDGYEVISREEAIKRIKAHKAFISQMPVYDKDRNLTHFKIELNGVGGDMLGRTCAGVGMGMFAYEFDKNQEPVHCGKSNHIIIW